MLAKENRAWVTHPFQAFFGHGKNANFVDCAKPVLDGPHQPEAAVGIALKVKHRVHHVLQHPRTRQCAFFGDVANQHDTYA